jgi:hypothetical protein
MTEAELAAELTRIEQELGKLYRERDPILAALAETRGPAVLPKPRHQTDKQRLIASCPRCGMRLEPS